MPTYPCSGRHIRLDAPLVDIHDIAEVLLLKKVKIGCTHAMLLFLDRNHRFANFLGEIFDLDHRDGAAILAITPAAFCKRLSQANTCIISFMKSHCGLVDPANVCQCRLRVNAAVDKGYINPNKLFFVHPLSQAKLFPEVLQTIRLREDTRRAAILYRSYSQLEPTTFMSWLTKLLNEMPEQSGSTRQLLTPVS